MLFLALFFILFPQIRTSNAFLLSHKNYSKTLNHNLNTLNNLNYRNLDTLNGVNYRNLNAISNDSAVVEMESERSKKIKLLRSSTGRGAQECYKALMKANGDVKLASQIILNTVSDAKNPSNNGEIVMLLEGTVALSCVEKVCCMIDMRCDTDFVAKNKLFTAFAKSFSNSALLSFTLLNNSHTPEDTTLKPPVDKLLESVLSKVCLRCGKSVGETGKYVRSALRESISVARISFLVSDPDEYFVFYVHSSLDPKISASYAGTAAAILSFQIPNTNKFYNLHNFHSDPQGSMDTVESVGVLNCCLEGVDCVYSSMNNVTQFDKELETDELKRFLRQMALHTVAEKPKEIDIERFDSGGRSEMERELEKLVNSGKTREMAERIVKGKLRKKYGQDVLMEQIWTFGNGELVSEAMEKMSKKVSREIKLKKFISYAISDDLINYKHPQNCVFYNTNINF
ncbi:Elongation factor TS family protein [Theileria parva strain Muguga]|uniref:Elongation factor TS family protein n=1 Tax=Theileria parva strain Muguga TaxID=333668 RepID=UPI001C619154|nr:Elongation factor TS family protein [Theileria parva strain Muguga]EAN31605.2 Elongation factor TS family protein [Theileria parva strain Muguga]